MKQIALLCLLVVASLAAAGSPGHVFKFDYWNETIIDTDYPLELPPHPNSTHQRRWLSYTHPVATWPVRMVNAGKKIDLSGGGDPGYGPAEVVRNAGAGVNVYVLDCGVMISHATFGSAVNFKSVPTHQDSEYVVDPGIPSGMDDVTGHGTFVASVVADHAPGAKIVNVKIGGITRSGYIDKAVMDVVAEHKLFQQHPPERRWKGSVIILSIDVPFDEDEGEESLQSALKAAWEAGIPVVVAAGNEGMVPPPSGSLCWFAPYTVCVGAVDRNYAMLKESNQGRIVEFLAPGGDIPGAGTRDVWHVKQSSGTSLAVPVVAALMANVISCEGINNNVLDVKIRLVQQALLFEVSGADPSMLPSLVQTGLNHAYRDPGAPYAGVDPSFLTC
ncbi:MAG: hypothetical protein Q9227_004113 [Pyrenula ochraceoflavens]